MAIFVDPLRDLAGSIHKVEKPARYLGGELGSNSPIEDQTDARLRIALCFPDLYEIGMSNNAIRLLYNQLSTMSDSVVCERVFAPAPDFEKLLEERDIPLYTLESGIPLFQCDIIAFSVGYELLATNMLTILQAGKVPLLREERDSTSPVVIAGGPAITNPHPFGKFLDAVYIGEAEAGFYELVRRLADIKAQSKAQEMRTKFLEEIRTLDQVWIPYEVNSDCQSGEPCKDGVRSKSPKTVRAVFDQFSTTTAFTAYPVAVLPTVQSHGSVEIMRGCPNGCRFCHAGYFYRPQRIKSSACIDEEVRILVEDGGYQEITLASLSSGDYPDIVSMFRSLNEKWKERHVSFQLPSLKVNSFTLPLLAQLSEVRKSGLTFAVETPIEAWQFAINKAVSLEKILSILKEARSLGFRSAKFYFMIGLPVPGKGMGEADAISAFLRQVSVESKMAINVTIGTFVPKPHTPYEQQSQLGEEEALNCIHRIKDSLRQFRSISISYHSPFSSVLEGLICRGDDGVGDVILSAFRNGARLDAWDEYMKRDAWREAIKEHAQSLGLNENEWIARMLSGRPREDLNRPIWKDVSLNVSNSYYDHELNNSMNSIPTVPCADPCEHPCGACNKNAHIVCNSIQLKELSDAATSSKSTARPLGKKAISKAKLLESFSIGDFHQSLLEDKRLILKYRKRDQAAFYPLHSVPNVFARAFLILGIPVRFSEGFNPIARLEFTPPLSLGFDSDAEICSAWLASDFVINDNEGFLNALNSVLPSGLIVQSVRIGDPRNLGKNSIGTIFSGSLFAISPRNALGRGLLESYLNIATSDGSSSSFASSIESINSEKYFYSAGNRLFVRTKELQSDLTARLTIHDVTHSIMSNNAILGEGKLDELDYFSITRLQTYAKKGESPDRSLFDAL
ncbi:MAG TPA: TIGR03960 family B12-binding radical SAM protein [Spirochaetales bacterium]|nr:TIGR03960 family B12-binding radical SAM protein [Spirochaetales bacterium]